MLVCRERFLLQKFPAILDYGIVGEPKSTDYGGHGTDCRLESSRKHWSVGGGCGVGYLRRVPSTRPNCSSTLMFSREGSVERESVTAERRGSVRLEEQPWQQTSDLQGGGHQEYSKE